MYLAERGGRHGGLSPPPHAPVVQDRALAAVPAGGLRVTLAAKGPVIDWVADHRKHHTFADEDGDPHSPACRAMGRAWRGDAAGPLARARGLAVRDPGDKPLEAPFLRRTWVSDPKSGVINRRFPSDRPGEPGVPFRGRALRSAAVALDGGPPRASVGSGLVRVFIGHHVTWSINSICHFFGRAPVRERMTIRRTSSGSRCRALGEAWHHNHHAFPNRPSTGCVGTSWTRRGG